MLKERYNEIVLCTFIYISYYIINILFHSKLLLSILLFSNKNVSDIQ